MFAHLAVGGRFGRLLRIIVIFFGRRTTGPFRVVAIHAAIPLGRQLFFVHDTPQSSPFPALVAFDPRGIGRARGLTKNGSAIAIQIFFAHEVADNVTVGRSRSSGSRSIAQSRRGNRTCGGQGGHVTIGTTVTGGRHGGAGSFEGYLFLAALLFVVIVIVVALEQFIHVRSIVVVVVMKVAVPKFIVQNTIIIATVVMVHTHTTAATSLLPRFVRLAHEIGENQLLSIGKGIAVVVVVVTATGSRLGLLQRRIPIVLRHFLGRLLQCDPIQTDGLTSIQKQVVIIFFRLLTIVNVVIVIIIAIVRDNGTHRRISILVQGPTHLIVHGLLGRVGRFERGSGRGRVGSTGTGRQPLADGTGVTLFARLFMGRGATTTTGRRCTGSANPRRRRRRRRKSLAMVAAGG
mmetsp:Transcript_6549/g.16828  ORF Transcript_6549/g.16828 Transcript_6549/m.16828 type:complete len:404 (-) Transcript_6549:423-1634(-)